MRLPVGIFISPSFIVSATGASFYFIFDCITLPQLAFLHLIEFIGFFMSLPTDLSFLKK